MVKGFRYLSTVTTLVFRESDCIGCGRCLEVCPHQVFQAEGKKVGIVDRDACMECGACARNCPVEAITVDAGVGCASGIISECLRERNIRVGSSNCCS